MADLDGFAKRMDKYAIGTVEGAGRVVRAVALAADAKVVELTPVDSGRARSNWRAEIDKPAEGVIEPYAAGEGLGSAEGGNRDAAMAQAASKIAEYDANRHQAIHITNNVPYIRELNNGSSTQAPENFVEQGVMAGVQKVRRSKLFTGV